MISRSWLILGLALTLSGCLNREQKIVDLAAGVFIIFIILVALKLATPVILRTRLADWFIRFLKQNIRFFVIPLYVLATCLVIVGIYFEGIHRIHIFTGFLVFVIAIFLNRYASQEVQEDKKQMLEIVVLGISVFAVLILLWYLGSDMLKAL